MSRSHAGRRGNLTQMVIEQLANRIDTHVYGQGEKLPSEKSLCQEFGVSRTVIREAVASLKLGGRLIAHQGRGVFVAEDAPRRVQFEVSSNDAIRDAQRILELRRAVELESAALAAERRTPKQLSDITTAYDNFNALDASDQNELVECDFNFHLAIARATGNGYFPRLLESLGPDIILDLNLKHSRLSLQDAHQSYLKKSSGEHGEILSAICQSDPVKARTAMKRHLDDGLVRYRRIIAEDQ